MDYYTSSKLFCKWDGLVQNRVKVINGVTEDRCTYGYRDGWYRVSLLGKVLARYRANDVEAARDAFERMDAVFDALWMVRREGFATFV